MLLIERKKNKITKNSGYSKCSLTFHVECELLALAAADPVAGLAGVGPGPLAADPLEDQREVGEDDPAIHVLLQLLPLHERDKENMSKCPTEIGTLEVNFTEEGDWDSVMRLSTLFTWLKIYLGLYQLVNKCIKSHTKYI